MCIMFHHINIIMSGNKHYRRWIHMRFITQCNKTYGGINEDEYWKYDIPYFLLVPVVFHDYSLWKLSVGTLFLPVSA